MAVHRGPVRNGQWRVHRHGAVAHDVKFLETHIRHAGFSCSVGSVVVPVVLAALFALLVRGVGCPMDEGLLLVATPLRAVGSAVVAADAQTEEPLALAAPALTNDKVNDFRHHRWRRGS